VTPHPEEKRSILVAYFEAVAAETIVPAARLFVGEIFLGDGSDAYRVDWNVVAWAIQNLTRLDDDELRAHYSKLGGIAAVAADAFEGRLPSGISVTEAWAWGAELAAASGLDEQRVLVAEMLARLSSLEARYLVQLIVGDFQIGLDATDIDAAVAARHPR
jgi:hypothetical protein